MTSVESYAGTSSPYTFNGLVRHYFLRQSPSLADLQIELAPKDERWEQSHAIAKRLRTALEPVAATLGATIQVVEVPPGPPVLQTLVAEVYGPDPTARLELARQVRSTFAATPGVVDADWYVESRRPTLSLHVDSEKAAAAGLSAADVASLVRLAGAGRAAGVLHDATAREDVPCSSDCRATADRRSRRSAPYVSAVAASSRSASWPAQPQGSTSPASTTRTCSR